MIVDSITRCGCAMRLMSMMLLAGCGVASEDDAALQGRAAAKVDGIAITRQSVVAAVPADDLARRKEQLDGFIAEQLLANAAVRERLWGDARVVTALEAARRRVLARAYIEKLAAGLGPIPIEDIRRYYEQHPELFAKRRIYRLQEIVVTAPEGRVAEITKQFASLKTFRERADWLTKMGIPYTIGVAVKAAEDLPADLLATLANLKDGNAFNVPGTKGFTSVQITGLEDMPLTLEQAQGDIERYLANQRLGKLVNQETERLRSAARIEYFAPYSAKSR